MADSTEATDLAAWRDALAVSAEPIDQARTLPPVSYNSDAVAAAEQTIFDHQWLGVGRADMVPNAQSYRTLDIAGHSIILLRDADGQLRAYANTCRHRGARLLDGDGSCRVVQCPFHAWTYRLDGTLASAPHMSEAADFDRDDFGLVAHRVEERLGFVFVCVDAKAPPLDDALGDLGAVHAPWPLDTLVTTRRRELQVDCNWKAFLEVFNDYYHLPYVHPLSLGDLYARPEPRDETKGAFTSQFGLTQGTGGLLLDDQELALPPMPGLSEPETNGVRYTWVFPTMTFAAGADSLWVYEAYPLGPHRCHVVQSVCFPPETIASPEVATTIESYYERFDAALDEDVPALVNQHRGLLDPAASRGRFQPLLEPSVAAFARWYASLMGTAEDEARE